MQRSAASDELGSSPQQLRDEWLERLTHLVSVVENYARELGWSTRRIETRMRDSDVGTYDAPALLLQEETTRILLEPIARVTPGSDGVVDLCLMPAYDDIGNLYFSGSAWRLRYVWPGIPSTGMIDPAEDQPFSKETLREVLEEMKKHAASSS